MAHGKSTDAPSLAAVSTQDMAERSAKAHSALIDAGTTLSGTLVCKGDLAVGGVVEGNLRGKRLAILAGGSVSGDISAESVFIDGHFDGVVSANELELGPRAHVVGDLHYTLLSIDKDASFQGAAKATPIDPGKPPTRKASADPAKGRDSEAGESQGLDQMSGSLEELRQKLQQ